MNNLYLRTVTGIIYVAITVGAIIFSPYVTSVLFLMITLTAVAEFLKIFRGRARPILSLTLIISGIVYGVIALQSLDVLIPKHLTLLVIPVLAVFAIELFRKSTTPFLNIAVTFVVLLYVVLPLALLNNLYEFGIILNGASFQFILTFFILIWVNDTGAYLTGLLIGRNRMYPAVSPKKTWEGFVGGAVLALLAGWLSARYIDGFEEVSWVVFTVIIIIFATVGDLVESKLKRNFNVKDSGSILPGHGGILDRFDGVLLSAPVLFLYIKYCIS